MQVCCQGRASLRTRPSSASRAQPVPPFAQCPGGDRVGGLPRSLQKHAKVCELDDELVLDGDQLVGAFAFVSGLGESASLLAYVEDGQRHSHF